MSRLNCDACINKSVKSELGVNSGNLQKCCSRSPVISENCGSGSLSAALSEAPDILNSALTCSRVIGVSSQSERDAALVAGETAPMEELPLGADAFQQVDPLTAEVTLLTVCH